MDNCWCHQLSLIELQCSPFFLSDRWLFFVADFYSVFIFSSLCLSMRNRDKNNTKNSLYFQFNATTCYSNFISFSTCLLILSLVIFLSKRDFITIFFKSFDFSVDSFAFSTKICLFLSFPQYSWLSWNQILSHPVHVLKPSLILVIWC